MDLKEWFYGLTASKVLAMNGDAESQVLDCKGEPRNDKNDNALKKLLATALSGFANATGGVVLWGVDARKIDGIDCIGDFPGVSDAERLASRLNELTPQATSPGIPGVEHRPLVLEGDRGFVATYVPATEMGPHMARYQEDRYYQRIGQSFMRMEPFQIADMFSRRAKPVLEVSAVHYADEDAGVQIFLTNRGRGAARAPFLQLEVEPAFIQLHYIPNHLEDERTVSPQRIMMFAGADFVIHPGMQLSVAGFAPSRDTRLLPTACVIQYQVGALDVEAQSGTVEVVFEQAPHLRRSQSTRRRRRTNSIEV